MTKQDFGVLCDKYQVNKRALKNILKARGFTRKNASREDVLETLFLNAPNLFWTRDSGDSNHVDYLDKNLIVELIIEMNEESDNESKKVQEDIKDLFDLGVKAHEDDDCSKGYYVERIPIKKFVGDRVLFDYFSNEDTGEKL